MEVKNVPQTVVDYIRIQIFSGQLTPGQKLLESQLAGQLNISRPPLREALRILEQDNLVYYLPRRGTFVTELSIEHCSEIYQAREMIEIYAIDLLQRKKVTDVPAIEKGIADVVGCTKPDALASAADKLKYFETLVQFHLQLVRTAGNVSITNMFLSIMQNLFRYQYFLVYETKWTKLDSEEDHREVTELIKSGEYNKAKKMLRQHFARAIDEIIKWMEEQSFPAHIPSHR